MKPLQRMPQDAEAHLERGLQQPGCGCRVEYTWLWTQGDDWPAAVAVTGLQPCAYHRALQPTYHDTIATQFEDELKRRLTAARASGKPPLPIT